MRLACFWRNQETEIIGYVPSKRGTLAIIKWKNGLKDVKLGEIRLHSRKRREKPMLANLLVETSSVVN